LSLISLEFLPNFGRSWWLRFCKGRSALNQSFRSLKVQIVRDVELELPLGAHRSYWTGVSPDADLIEFLARTLPDGGLFLDVGANIGVYGASLWKLRGRVRGTAFEPIPTTQALLESTFALNNVPFSLERIAVSDRAGTLNLSAYEHGLNNFWIKNDDGCHPTLQVPTVPLDEWCSDNPERVPSAIKIDVEGHELAVLQGARRTLRTHRPALVIECHAAAWDGLGVSRPALEEEVRAIGYRRVCDRDGRDVDYLHSQKTFHLLAMP